MHSVKLISDLVRLITIDPSLKRDEQARVFWEKKKKQTLKIKCRRV